VGSADHERRADLGRRRCPARPPLNSAAPEPRRYPSARPPNVLADATLGCAEWWNSAPPIFNHTDRGPYRYQPVLIPILVELEIAVAHEHGWLRTLPRAESRRPQRPAIRASAEPGTTLSAMRQVPAAAYGPTPEDEKESPTRPGPRGRGILSHLVPRASRPARRAAVLAVAQQLNRSSQMVVRVGYAPSRAALRRPCRRRCRTRGTKIG
jgi:hypothetical protein